MRPFVPIDFYEEDAEFVHANPNVISFLKIVPTTGQSFSKAFPFTVECYQINHEVVEYYFKTREEAKVFIKKVGGIN